MNYELKRFALILLLPIIIAAVSACSNLLVSHVELITPHETVPYERPPALQITVTGLEEFESLLLELILTHQETATIQYHGLENEVVQRGITQTTNNIFNNDPIAVYAVTDITTTITRIVAYYEIEIAIEFKRTAEQIQEIMHASTQRYMMTQLLEVMSQYKDEAVFLTNLRLEKDDIIEQIVEIYYRNTHRIVMMPFVTVEIFPETGTDRIYEIKFGYTEDPEMLRLFGERLDLSVRQNAARADGETDGEILLSLVENLAVSAVYDEGMAGAIAMHGPQNIAATAYGALVGGRAVGEGFAMAFRALCDELRLDCRIVLGYLNGVVHAWNIVLLDGFYYHIDVAICATEGLEAGFLKTDADFLENYTWDNVDTPRCYGPLTLEDLRPTVDPDDPDNPDDPNDTNGTNDDSDPDSTDADPDSAEGNTAGDS